MDAEEMKKRTKQFAIEIGHLVLLLEKNDINRNYSNQIIRSGTSPALNYGEAQSAESRKDFIHKIKIILKELRETLICLKIVQSAKLHDSGDKLFFTMKENDELISIFVKTVETAQKNLNAEKSTT